MYVLGVKMRNKNVSSAKLFLRNSRAAPACGPLTLPANKHPYLFSLGRIAAEATSPCRREITSYRWRLSPGQGSRVTAGGGSGAVEQQSGKETGSLLGSVWALLSRQAAPNLIEYLAQPLTRLSFSISSDYFVLRLVCRCSCTCLRERWLTMGAVTSGLEWGAGKGMGGW